MSGSPNLSKVIQYVGFKSSIPKRKELHVYSQFKGQKFPSEVIYGLQIHGLMILKLLAGTNCL